MSAVPVIDLSLPEDQAVQAIKAACTTTGFFQVANHGVPEDVVQRQFKASKQFFSQSEERKALIRADKNNRGWTRMSAEKLDPERQLSQGDTKEGLYFGREVPADSPEAELPLHGPNQWPSEELLPDFRAAMEAYFAAVWQLGRRLISMLALALGLPPDTFLQHFSAPMLFLRPLHYAATRSDIEKGIFGAGAHSDYGCITILATDGTPGLQVHYDGAWQTVTAQPGAFVVNLGDMLERWTNGVFKSTLHRVLMLGGQERYSTALFMDASFHAPVAPLPACCSKDNPPRHAPTTAGAYLLGRYAATHTDFKNDKRSPAAA